LDITGPADVFHAANLLGAMPPYRITFASVAGGPISFSNGLVTITQRLQSIRIPIDTLIVGGGLQLQPAADPLVSYIRRRADTLPRLSSVCTGALLLAEAGVLDGRSATTHWSACERLARRYPQVNVVGDRIYVRDEHVWTSAGVTAGMDLALAMVADDHSPELAREIARWLVIYLQRPGSQSQFSHHLDTRTPIADNLQPVIDWISSNLDGDCSVERLASVASMSARHLARVFISHLSVSPAKYVHIQRLQEGKSLLETTNLDIAAVAKRCGFPRTETFHRGFRQQFGVTPTQHRHAFSLNEQ
jgi:transcriptional regulator GlxA family with amidase domain